MTHHDEPQRRRRHLPVGAAVAVIVCMAITLAGCSNTEPTPVPKGDEPTTAPTPTEPAWQDKYSEKQLAGYEDALNRWTEYQTKSAPIWAAGKATPAAKKLFEEFYPSPVWQALYAQLEMYEQVEVTGVGRPTVLWSRAKRISQSATSVTIEQCTDYTTATTVQRGEEVARVKRFEKPLVREISLSKPAGYAWLIYQSDPPPKKGFSHCTAEDSR